MNLRSVSTVAVLAALIVPAFAQSASSTSDEEANLALTLPTDEWYVPKNTITFGVRVLGNGIKANFGNLGSMPTRTIEQKVTVAKPGTTTNETIEIITRSYDNGSMRQDYQRPDELLPTSVSPTDGAALSYGVYPGNGRYQTWISSNSGGTITNTQVSDQLSYQQGVTRYWNYASASQIQNDRVAMSTYSARSEGATAAKEEGLNSGLELTVSRDLSAAGKRFQWSLTAGIALNNMNAKTGGTIASTLAIHTDYYQLNGPAPTGTTLGGPSYVDLTRPDGTTSTDGQETTTTIGDTPVSSSDSLIAGGASIQGNWKVKGAYMLVRVGPTLRTKISERFGLSASLGVAGAYAGSRYSVVETLDIPDVLEPITESIDNVKNKFLGGFYADVNVDWVANERTGLFAGVNMQNLGGYDQEVGGRTAKIDFGSAIGVRGGLSFKF